MYFENIDVNNIAPLLSKMFIYTSTNRASCSWMSNGVGLCMLLKSTCSSGPTTACDGPKFLLRLCCKIFSSDTLLHEHLHWPQWCFLWGQRPLAASKGLASLSSSPTSSFCIQSKAALVRAPTQKNVCISRFWRANRSFIFSVWRFKALACKPVNYTVVFTFTWKWHRCLLQPPSLV